jgi:hypothetical protein
MDRYIFGFIGFIGFTLLLLCSYSVLTLLLLCSYCALTLLLLCSYSALSLLFLKQKPWCCAYVWYSSTEKQYKWSKHCACAISLNGNQVTLSISLKLKIRTLVHFCCFYTDLSPNKET